MVNLNKWTYPGMKIYGIQESIIEQLFRSGSTVANTDKDEINLKVTTLNLYYSTFMQATKQMADGIYDLKIDDDLLSGNISLVEQIAKKTKRRNYSFATKYCACHQPDKFPIYDEIVGKYLAHVAAKGNIPGYSGAWTTIQKNMKADYAIYKEIYDTFMQYYDLTTLSYREVDWYIWVAHKCESILSGLKLFTLI